MKNLIPPIFTKELENSFSYMQTSLKLLNEEEIGIEEKHKIVKNYLSTTQNSISIVQDYLEFIKIKSNHNLKISKVNIYEVLNDVKIELNSVLKEKLINIYIEKNSVNIESNKFWFKKAIYYILLHLIKHNKNKSFIIYAETTFSELYISISTEGKEAKKKKLKDIFKEYSEINEKSQIIGVELGIAKYILANLNNSILKTKSNIIYNSNFIINLQKKSQTSIIKKVSLLIIISSLIIFLFISYFPIYPQKYSEKNIDNYKIYNFKDGSIVIVKKNSKYEISAYKNLYNTKYLIHFFITKRGDIYLKTLKNRAFINVSNRKFEELKNSEFEISKDNNKTRLAVFNGIVKNEKIILKKGKGAILFKKQFKLVKLLPSIAKLKFNNSYLSFKNNSAFIKYKIIISNNINFSDIEDIFYDIDNNINLNLKYDTQYFIKIFGIEKNGLASNPKIVKYINLTHYNKALKLIQKKEFKQALLELKLSTSTINNYSSLPYFEIAKLYFLEHNYKESIREISKAIRIDKKLDYYILLFGNYDKIKKIKEVENKINYLFNKYPRNIDILYFKSLLLYKNGNLKKSQEYLFNLLELKPHYKNANYLMSKILAKQGNQKLSIYYKNMEN